MSQRRHNPKQFGTRASETRYALSKRLARAMHRIRPTTRVVIGFVLVTLVTTLLLARMTNAPAIEQYREGDTVRTNVISPANITAQVTVSNDNGGEQKENSRAVVMLKRHQVVAREGEPVTPQMRAEFEAIRSYMRNERRPLHFIGLLLIVAALYWTAWSFIEYRSARVQLALSKASAFAFVALSVVIETVFMLIGFKIADSVPTQSFVAPFNDPLALSFAIPFASAALLVSLLLDTQIAMMTGLIVALFAGLLAPDGILMTCYALVSSTAAIYGIGRYRERQSVTVAGIFVAAMNALMTLAVLFITQQELTFSRLLLAVACGVAGGLFTIIFTAGAVPINESLFGILTDVKLLELSNADLPILSQLALHAPGTNQHSHAISQLAEEACRTIGANALLARIAALYHDIGKLAAPEMFIENQNGHNPHDTLRPADSARIIINHVTYGAHLAREIGLPKQIIDFIEQHHGTRTLHYFLRKAEKQLAPGETIDEADFRYPGPKPQTKEAAVMMLADSCEAAARSLANPCEEGLRAIVEKIFDAILSDNQLDECSLTLRELNKVRDSILHTLLAIYHPRVEYAGFNPVSESANGNNATIHGSATFPATLAAASLDAEETGIKAQRATEKQLREEAKETRIVKRES
jgi:putative nucleotidyltransferase with HDIG domain